MKIDLPLKLEAKVVWVGEPEVCKDRNSSREGRVKIEFRVDAKPILRGGRRIDRRKQTFWGGTLAEELERGGVNSCALPQELVGHRVRIYSDGFKQAIEDIDANVWYKS